jgi:hypothetical protein
MGVCVPQALLNEKPKEDAADPRDVEAIVLAEKHMGDYKLKSSPNYEVSGHALLPWVSREAWGTG